MFNLAEREKGIDNKPAWYEQVAATCLILDHPDIATFYEPNRLLTAEGINGAGKTWLIGEMAGRTYQTLEARGITSPPVVLSRGGGANPLDQTPYNFLEKYYSNRPAEHEFLKQQHDLVRDAQVQFSKSGSIIDGLDIFRVTCLTTQALLDRGYTVFQDRGPYSMIPAIIQQLAGAASIMRNLPEATKSKLIGSFPVFKTYFESKAENWTRYEWRDFMLGIFTQWKNERKFNGIPLGYCLWEDTPVDIAAGRLGQRGEKDDRPQLERETSTFEILRQLNPFRVIRINGNQSMENVFEETMQKYQTLPFAMK